MYISVINYDESSCSLVLCGAVCFGPGVVPAVEKVCEIYAAAAKAMPQSEEILTHLFMAYVRVGDYQRQQQVGSTGWATPPWVTPLTSDPALADCPFPAQGCPQQPVLLLGSDEYCDASPYGPQQGPDHVPPTGRTHGGALRHRRKVGCRGRCGGMWRASVLAGVCVAALCACRGEAVPDDPGAAGQLGEGAGGAECPPG